MSEAATYYHTLTPDEFIAQVQAATYTPPSRALMQELLQRYADLVDHDIERANAEDAALQAAVNAAVDCLFGREPVHDYEGPTKFTLVE